MGYTSMATNASTSAVSGCAGDEPVRENDRFVCTVYKESHSLAFSTVYNFSCFLLLLFFVSLFLLVFFLANIVFRLTRKTRRVFSGRYLPKNRNK